MQRGSFQVLVFEVGGRRYGLPAADVQELLRAVRVVPLPGAPAVVEGLIDLRGRVVPVLDARRRFGLPSRPIEYTDHLIVARAGGRLVALHVDHALDLLELGPADVEDARGVVPGVESVGWVARLPNDLVPIHDLGSFLSPRESAALEAASAGAPPETGGGS